VRLLFGCVGVAVRFDPGFPLLFSRRVLRTQSGWMREFSLRRPIPSRQSGVSAPVQHSGIALCVVRHPARDRQSEMAIFGHNGVAVE